MKIALVHDYLNQYGGAERLLEAEMQLWPDAPVYTSLYDKEVMQKAGFNYPDTRIRTSFMQSFPFKRNFNKHYFFIYPYAFGGFDFSGYDVVISDSSYAAKYLRVKKPTIHIAYIHTPPRFLWGYDRELTSYKLNWFDAVLTPIYSLLVPPLKALVKHKDFAETKKIDFLICNSKEVQRRVKEVYKRDADVIYPPVNVEKFMQTPTDPVLAREHYFLVVSRLGGYKRVDIAVEAFNQLGLPLKVIGTGPEFEALKKRAKPNVELLGRLDDETVQKYMKNAQALIFPTEEDFGVVVAEANAAGIPVIAYGKGGATEIVINGKTGLLFPEQTAAALVNALDVFSRTTFDPKLCQQNAQRFSTNVFQQNLANYVTAKVSQKEKP